MIRCNNCMAEYEAEEELEMMQDSDGDWMRACPTCRTDNYLMDID